MFMKTIGTRGLRNVATQEGRVNVLVADVLRNAGGDTVRNLSLVIVYQEVIVVDGFYLTRCSLILRGSFLVMYSSTGTKSSYLLRLCKSYALWNGGFRKRLLILWKPSSLPCSPCLYLNRMDEFDVR